MAMKQFDVRALAGKTAHLEIIDDATGGWGNVGVGKIVFTDNPHEAGPLEDLPDFGTMALALLGKPADLVNAPATATFSEKLSGSLGRKLQIAPGASAQVTFVLTWHFPNLSLGGDLRKAGQYYATKFASAQAVAQYVAEHFDRLASETRLWHDTWYDSTLPFWFLDRTFLNTSILATSTTLPVCQRTLLRLGGRRLLRGDLRPCLSIRARHSPAVSRPRTRHARES